jgi:hypothetical protein
LFDFNFWTAAIVSFILIGLSFALYLPKLGFYLDDWPQLYSLIVRGTEGIKTYFLYDDRPFGWWPDLLIFKIWGTNPVGWHLTNYLLRWLVGLGMWGVFTQLWQAHKREIFWAVQLFAVLPLFNQQSMGLTFIAHWFCYALFFLSLFLMVLAVQKSKFTGLLLILSLAANAANLFTYENFIGVEFLRPVILWFALSEFPKKQRIKKTLLFWLPFLLLAGFYVIWRVYLMQNVRGLDPVLLHNLVNQPGQALLQLGTYFLSDVLFMLVGVWFPTLTSDVMDLQTPFRLIALGLSLATVAGLWLFTREHSKFVGNPAIGQRNYTREFAIVGMLGVILGLAPGWLVNRSLTAAGLWNDRFGLPGMWAVPLVIIALITFLTGQLRGKGEIVLIILLGLAVGRNFTVTNEYKWSTTWQERFSSQLKWRAPDIKDDTTILADNELFMKMGVYPTSFMVNLIYPDQQTEFSHVDYWFLTLNKYFDNKLPDLGNGMEIEQQHWYVKFSGWSTESLVINWQRETLNCLWVLTTNDRYNPMITANTRQALAASNLSMIKSDSTAPWPDTNLFGIENRNTWCYYYESADLARQTGDWQKVVSLYEEAGSKNYKPANGVELIPFIEAYARAGKANVAANLTDLAKILTPNMRNYTCDTWNRLAKEIVGDPSFDAEYKVLSEKDLCWEVK